MLYELRISTVLELISYFSKLFELDLNLKKIFFLRVCSLLYVSDFSYKEKPAYYSCFDSSGDLSRHDQQVEKMALFEVGTTHKQISIILLFA